MHIIVRPRAFARAQHCSEADAVASRRRGNHYLTLSTKPEVHDLLQHSHGTEPRPKTTRIKTVKFGHVVSEMCIRTDEEQTDTLIAKFHCRIYWPEVR